MHTAGKSPAVLFLAMKDDQSNPAPKDPDHVCLADPEEVEYWTKKFNCTEAQLKAAVMAVGDNPTDICVQLQK